MKKNKGVLLNFLSAISFFFFAIVGLVLGFGGMVVLAYCMLKESWWLSLAGFAVMAVGAAILNYLCLNLPGEKDEMKNE